MRLLVVAFVLFSPSLFAQTESLTALISGFVDTAYLTPKVVNDVAYIGFWQNPDEGFSIQIESSMGVPLMETTSEEVTWSERGFHVPTGQLAPGVYACRLVTERGAVKILRFRVSA